MTATTRLATKPAAIRRDWRSYAACREVDLDLHFPTPHTPGWKKQMNAAKKVCAGCPVRQACLQWALDTKQPAGIWGGKSERERRALLGIRESQTQRCLEHQVWIEKQLAAGVSQRKIAARLRVTRVTLSRAIERFEAERLAAASMGVKAA